ncbi:hypothetical protein BS78_05G163300 [Paspalum vaginatum]|nr:hypothetical protein BS78_05G163300 [Paspalum vaginatum]
MWSSTREDGRAAGDVPLVAWALAYRPPHPPVAQRDSIFPLRATELLPRGRPPPPELLPRLLPHRRSSAAEPEPRVLLLPHRSCASSFPIGAARPPSPPVPPPPPDLPSAPSYLRRAAYASGRCRAPSRQVTAARRATSASGSHRSARSVLHLLRPPFQPPEPALGRLLSLRSTRLRVCSSSSALCRSSSSALVVFLRGLVRLLNQRMPNILILPV